MRINQLNQVLDIETMLQTLDTNKPVCVSLAETRSSATAEGPRNALC